MLEIRNVHLCVDGQEILKGLDLSIGAGEVHTIMGPNGSGKSTLAYALAGRDGYEITEGEIVYEGKDLLAMSPEERACEGVFLAFQYPVEIPGVSNVHFLKTALNAHVLLLRLHLTPAPPGRLRAGALRLHRFVPLESPARLILPVSAPDHPRSPRSWPRDPTGHSRLPGPRQEGPTGTARRSR